MLLCCGEALIDMIPMHSKKGAKVFAPHCGGSVFNTAVALGRLGQPVAMLGGLSSDMFGRQLTGALRDSQVDTSLLVISDRPSTLAFVEIANDQASYTFFDENSAGRMLQATDLPALPDKITALYFGGISLAGGPCAETYAELSAQQAPHRVIMLDANIRPGFITDPAAYRHRLGRMIANADIVKVSEEDLNWLYPDLAAPEDKIKHLRSFGPSVVILTHGASGASGFPGNGDRVDVAACKVDIVDTVGAGDTFNAGVLAKLGGLNLLSKPALAGIGSGPISQALEYGSKVAAITVSRAGANPPWSHEITSRK